LEIVQKIFLKKLPIMPTNVRVSRNVWKTCLFYRREFFRRKLFWLDFSTTTNIDNIKLTKKLCSTWSLWTANWAGKIAFSSTLLSLYHDCKNREILCRWKWNWIFGRFFNNFHWDEHLTLEACYQLKSKWYKNQQD
jgi:hypothetical protein